MSEKHFSLFFTPFLDLTSVTSFLSNPAYIHSTIHPNLLISLWHGSRGLSMQIRTNFSLLLFVQPRHMDNRLVYAFKADLSSWMSFGTTW